MRTDWCYGPQKLNYVELKKVSGATSTAAPCVARATEQ